MSSTMEVDPPKEGEIKKVSVHPLAIVNMSDQYTRITCGGSALPKDAPVVGLLFGKWVENSAKEGGGTSLQIVDADDIPTDRSEAAKSQVSLHHAVFPQHDVVGWYRVGNSEEPSPQDLALTQELKTHYYNNNNNNNNNAAGEGAAGSAADAGAKAMKPFFFSLLQVRPAKIDAKMDSNNNKEDDDEEEELPLNLYEIQIHDQQNPVLVGVENWSLETSEAERIAVERVVREQPQQDLKSNNTAAAATSKTGGKKNDNNNNIAKSDEEMMAAAPTQPTSAYVNYMSSVQHSLEAMDDRIKLIIEYLERMGNGEIPPNYSLLRQIQGLVLQLGPLQQASATQSEPIPLSERDSELFAHLAAVAKTIQSVHSYTDKFRIMSESRPTGGREGRRGY